MKKMSVIPYFLIVLKLQLVNGGGVLFTENIMKIVLRKWCHLYCSEFEGNASTFL